VEPFRFEVLDAPERIHGLDLGHITISAPAGEITSKGRTPDQAMMLFPSIANLLDGVSRVASGPKGEKFRFPAVDSSFEMAFAREKGDGISLTRDRKSFGTVPARELVEALWAGVTALIHADGGRFDRHADASCEAAFGDFDAAVGQFSRVFNLPLPA
jgi:hypothetical protein